MKPRSDSRLFKLSADQQPTSNFAVPFVGNFVANFVGHRICSLRTPQYQPRTSNRKNFVQLLATASKHFPT
jgi:hypothetical protein